MSLLYADGVTPSVFFHYQKGKRAHEIFFESVFQSVLSAVDNIFHRRMSSDVRSLEGASCGKFF